MSYVNDGNPVQVQAEVKDGVKFWTIDMSEQIRPTRNRAKQVTSLNARLLQAACAAREAARTVRSEDERDALIKKARRYEVTANLDRWLSSPGLLPPD